MEKIPIFGKSLLQQNKFFIFDFFDSTDGQFIKTTKKFETIMHQKYENEISTLKIETCTKYENKTLSSLKCAKIALLFIIPMKIYAFIYHW